MLWLTMLAAGCSFGLSGANCKEGLDLDGDGLDQCVERWVGTDEELADTDGDGLTDGEEFDCVSDPLDDQQVCYACGWPHADPGDLTNTGPRLGNRLTNLVLVDQCGEDVSLHDLAYEYHILWMAPLGCESCLDEASGLVARSRAFSSDFGVPFSYVVALYEDADGGAPSREAALEYAGHMQAAHDLPVLVDTNQELLDYTPFDGSEPLGKCVLSPDMRMLDCFTGTGDDQGAFETILAHVLGG